MCLNMSGRQGKSEQQLSIKTLLLLYPNMLWHSGTYQKLALQFSTDMFEKAFGKLRQGSGGSDFIIAHQFTENIRIKQP